MLGSDRNLWTPRYNWQCSRERLSTSPLSLAPLLVRSREWRLVENRGRRFASVHGGYDLLPHFLPRQAAFRLCHDCLDHRGVSRRRSDSASTVIAAHDRNAGNLPRNVLSGLVEPLAGIAISSRFETTPLERSGMGDEPRSAARMPDSVPPNSLIVDLAHLLIVLLLRHGMPKKWVRGWALLCLCSLMVTAAWTARNYQQFGIPIVMTSHGGYTLLLANNHDLYDHLQAEPVSRHWNPQRFHDEWLQSIRATESDALNELEQDSLAGRLAFQTIRERPAMFAWSCCVRLGWLWAWWPASEATASDQQSSYASARSGWQQFAIGLWYAWWEILALGGLLVWALGKSSISRRDPVVVCAWLLPLSLTMVHAIYWSNMRMRAPAMPVVYCFAGLMISYLGNRLGLGLWGQSAEQLERHTSKQLLVPILRWGGVVGLVLWNGIPCQAQTWDRLPDLPNRIGVAGPYVGAVDGMLIVAGGANFPGKPPWEGGTKVWHDEIYGWKPGDLNWRLLGHLPQASAYGVSVSTPQGMICVGGSTASNHLRSCYQLRFEKDRMVFVPLPDLPTSIANGCGAVLDGVLYLAGGQETPGSQMALASFWALDLNQPEGHWELLASWPGPPRILGLAGVLQDSFLLIGGAELEGTSNQATKRRYLKDAYAYRPSHGWEPLPNLPWSIVAAPSPALTLDPFTLLILGGDDGSLLEKDPRNHPGFF